MACSRWTMVTTFSWRWHANWSLRRELETTPTRYGKPSRSSIQMYSEGRSLTRLTLGPRQSRPAIRFHNLCSRRPKAYLWKSRLGLPLKLQSLHGEDGGDDQAR